MIAAPRPEGAAADPRAERRARPGQPRLRAAGRRGRLRRLADARCPPGAAAVHIGNPVRAAVLGAAGATYLAPGDCRWRSLVIGGSQGAGLFARVVPAALALLAPELRAPAAAGAAGAARGHGPRAATPTPSSGVAAELRGFFDDVPERLAEATLVISRAGAGSIADITVIGRPAILIPYAAATDDHQAANAARAGRGRRRLHDPRGGADAPRRSRGTSPRSCRTPRAPRRWPRRAARRAARTRRDATGGAGRGPRPRDRTERHERTDPRCPHDIGRDPLHRHRRHRHVGHRRGAAEPRLHRAGLGPEGEPDHRAAGGARARAVFIGQKAENLEGAEVVVISSAIKPGNPELDAARARNLPVVRRAEMLAELMRLKSNVAVAGTHGKTTTTSMVAALLDGGGMDPTVINGGVIHAYGSNARIGAGRVDGGRGRRERRHASTSCRRPSRSSPTSTPSTSTTTATSTRSRPRSTPSCRTSRSTASRSAASTTPRCRRWSAASPTAASRTYGFSPQADVQAQEPRVRERRRRASTWR